MKYIIILAILILNFYGLTCREESTKTQTESVKMNDDPINIFDVKVKTIDGKEVSMSDYKGKVLLIVNVASQCGYTPQYEGLQRVYEKYKDKGFEILAFPCNDFGAQEPGSSEEIKQFCSSKYNVTFQLFDKIKVLGDEKNPLYSKLIKYEPSGDIGWNFEKFIIDKNGNVTGRFKSKVKPEDENITTLIEKEISK
jgi:glutathione peroxidase